MRGAAPGVFLSRARGATQPAGSCEISASLNHLSPLPELRRLSQLAKDFPAWRASSGEGSAGERKAPSGCLLLRHGSCRSGPGRAAELFLGSAACGGEGRLVLPSEEARHGFGLTDGAGGTARCARRRRGHRLAGERGIAGGFLTLFFPLLPVPARVAPSPSAVGGTPAGTGRAAGFLSPRALQTQAGRRAHRGRGVPRARVQGGGRGEEEETFARAAEGSAAAAVARRLAARRHVHVSSCSALDALLVSSQARKVPETADLCTSLAQTRGQGRREQPEPVLVDTWV